MSLCLHKLKKKLQGFYLYKADIAYVQMHLKGIIILTLCLILLFKQLFIISFSKHITKSFIQQKGEDRERNDRERNSVGNKVFLNWFQRFRIEFGRHFVH